MYARQPGSAAAPTAGLHFTRELLAELEEQGIGQAFVTLHIGLDTFRPIGEDDLKDHTMHSEEIEVDSETAVRINAREPPADESSRWARRRSAPWRAWRSESLLIGEAGAGVVEPYRGRTSLFLRPGSTFRAVDIMLTNFHLPRSTLIVLVSAFAGRELTLRAYEHAIAQGYRFYSFGDAMLIV